MPSPDDLWARRQQIIILQETAESILENARIVRLRAQEAVARAESVLAEVRLTRQGRAAPDGHAVTPD